MQKIIVPVSKCIPGMVTAAPVIDLKNGTVILSSGQPLTPENINNIQHFVHTDIWVYLDSFNKLWQLSDDTIACYKKYSDALMSVLSNGDTEHFNMDEFESLCKNLIVDFKANHTLLGCTNLIEQLDATTYNHSLNVAFVSILICRWCGLDEHLTACAVKAALLHDIGMLNLSFNPFETKHPWSDAQQKEYEKHPIYSYNMVSRLKDLDPMIPKAILVHHEHCDGSGFPVHLSSPYINTLGKILGLADHYDLLRHKTHIFNVLNTLCLDDLTHYDPGFLTTFCSNVATYYIGSFAILNNGQIGEVAFINPACVYRPILKINDTFLNLYAHPELKITAIK